MNPKTKSSIQIISAITISLVMLCSIIAYFYVGYYGKPLFIILRFVFLAMIANSLGLVVLANLATVNDWIKKPLHFFLGIFLSVFLILGFLKNSFNSINEAYLALVLALCVASFLIIYFQSQELKTKTTIAYTLTILFSLLAVISFLNRPESSTPIQDNQVVFAITALLGLLACFNYTRFLIKRYLAVDFSTPVSITALVMSIFLLGFSLYVILVFRSLGGFLNYASKGIEGLINTKIAIYQLLYFVGISFLGVGWLVRRKFISVLKRLGLVLPNKKDLLLILIFAIVLYLVNWLMEKIGIRLNLIDVVSEKQTSQIVFQNFNSFGSMLVLAAAAGIGEEILFRGALQPKFGILVTTLLFVLLHGQYQIWGLATVFILGITLAYQRKISNTSCTIISHFLYDLIGLVLIFLVK